MSAPLSVGFDLDMTLIDTTPGFGAVLEVLGAELGVAFPVEEMTARLGPPLDHILSPHLASEAIAPAVDRFRALYPDHAITTVPLLPGAAEAVAAVRDAGGRVVVVTGKFTPNAQRHLDHLALDHEALAGEVWGVGKGEALLREGCSIYVGDHVHDVEGALAAGATSVSVLTGGCTREELLAAGTHAVLDDLTQFPQWLEEHLLTSRLAALDADLRDRGSVLVAYSGGADSALPARGRRSRPRRRPGRRRDRILRLAPAGRARPGARVRRVARRPGAHSRDPRDGAGGLSGEQRANAASSARPSCSTSSSRWPTSSGCSTSRPAPTPTTWWPTSGRASGLPPSVARSRRSRDAGLTKAQVRAASRAWALPTWDKPQAACLSSRIAYGIEVTPHRLARVERAETAVRDGSPRAAFPCATCASATSATTRRVELDAGAASARR